MTGNERVPVPATSPFWLEPVSIFGSFSITEFIKGLHMLTIPPILAPIRVMLTDASIPRGVGAKLSLAGTLLEGFSQRITLLLNLLGYR